MKYVKVAVNPDSLPEALVILGVPKYSLQNIQEITSVEEFNICIALSYTSEGAFAKWINRAKTFPGYRNIVVIKEEEYVSLTKKVEPNNENVREVVCASYVTMRVYVKVDPQQVDYSAKQMTKIKGVETVLSMSGTFQLEATIQASTTIELTEIVNTYISKVYGVLDLETRLIMKKY